MEKHESPELPADSGLPRPIVLRPEDLRRGRGRGHVGGRYACTRSRVLIAGGITVGPMMAASF